jgi:hypothetical protein
MNAFASELSPGDWAPDYRQSELWQRLQQFQLDDPQASLPFSLRLARENGWSRHYATRVIAEYKKFCYLALESSGDVTPSDAVDQAWHLHLVYTRSYWDDFCRNILRQELHHNPTRGGREQGDKYRGDYAGTLERYQQIFGIRPPEDIWPSVAERFANAGAFRRVDTSLSWILPKPSLRHLFRRGG